RCDGVPAAPRQLSAQLCRTHLPRHIRTQHGVLRLTPDDAFRLRHAAWCTLKPQRLRMSPNGLIAAIREPDFKLLYCRRRILRPEPRVVRVCPAHLATALLPWSLDPELLLGTAPSDDGRLDGTALRCDQDPIQNQPQELVTQCGRLAIPTCAEIGQER